jgi:hypothetical protein
MIAGLFNQGSGLGNQLHRYVATRVLAADKGYDWAMMYVPDGSGKPVGFKGESFMQIEQRQTNGHTFNDTFQERRVVHDGIDIRPYDPEFNFIKDDTVIEGEFQDERYWNHRIDDVREWLKVEPLEMPDDLCVIGFRGGEYLMFGDLFLTEDYWREGIRIMQEINPNMRFEVHTDDPTLAQRCFPDTKVIHNIGLNWRSVRYAKYMIIANSSFYILPALLNEDAKVIIAPRYWARRGKKIWATAQNYYRRFRYI